ncbi:MAG: sigma-70 family RNA polymerase sigma factor [Acidobacteriota bacterium]
MESTGKTGGGHAEVTRLLDAIGRGDPGASEELLPLVYDELRSLARARMAREPVGHTLQPTALVHEAYLRLLGPDDGRRPRWSSLGHFFGAAALAMRRILVERARRQQRIRHGGQQARVELDERELPGLGLSTDVLALDEALQALERHDERKHRVVMLRYFGGLSIDETAEALGLSPATVKTDWTYSRAWLHRALSESGLVD